MTKPLPASLTSYDFLKFTALVLMVIDHVGYYFFPDDLTWRAIGRLSAPVWLFLVGYAQSRDLSPKLWIGMIVLVVASYAVGQAILPINILGTIILCRLLIDPVMNAIRRTPDAIYPLTALLFFMTFITFPAFEYGASALLLVMVGYIARNRDDMGWGENRLLQFAGIAALGYGFYQAVLFFAFPPVMRGLVIFGLLAVMLALTYFRPASYPALTEKLPAPLSGLIRLGGRRTLEFYVLHLLIFKAAALAMGLPGYALFNFHIL